MEIRLISAQLADTRLTLGCAELGKNENKDRIEKKQAGAE